MEPGITLASMRKHNTQVTDNKINEPEGVLYFGGRVCSKKTVGKIQLCEQDAHETQPEQDVPNFLHT